MGLVFENGVIGCLVIYGFRVIILVRISVVLVGFSLEDSG